VSDVLFARFPQLACMGVSSDFKGTQNGLTIIALGLKGSENWRDDCVVPHITVTLLCH
jgi:hypothetical protein